MRLNRFIALLFVMLLILTLTACSKSGESDASLVQLEIKTATPMETLETYVRSYYFKEGTYDDYKKLFADDKNIRPIGEFDQYRRENEPKDLFPAGYKSVETLMTHMREVEIDDATVEIYYLENPNQEGIEGAQLYWILVKTDNQWLMN